MAESATLEWWAMNFERQVERVREALAALGVDDPVNYTGEVRNFRADALEERVARLERVAEAARRVEETRNAPRASWLLSGHSESDEVSCSCGFVSMAKDYDSARKSLRAHLLREQKKAAANANRPWDELREALVVLDGGDT